MLEIWCATMAISSKNTNFASELRRARAMPSKMNIINIRYEYRKFYFTDRSLIC